MGVPAVVFQKKFQHYMTWHRKIRADAFLKSELYTASSSQPKYLMQRMNYTQFRMNGMYLN
jgi:hypothetical protein